MGGRPGPFGTAAWGGWAVGKDHHFRAISNSVREAAGVFGPEYYVKH